MGIVVGGGTIAENYLGLVNNILDECGDQPVTTLVSPDQSTRNAMTYINLTVQDIYNSANDWPFAQEDGEITLVSGQQSYATATDFRRVVSDPRYALGQLRYIQPDHMDMLFPDQTTSGSPQMYTVFDGLFIVNPPPDDSFVASYPTMDYKYIREPSPMAADGDYPDLPDWMLETLKVGARAKYKKYREWPDANDDFALYAALLRKNRSMKDAVRSPKGWRQFR